MEKQELKLHEVANSDRLEKNMSIKEIVKRSGVSQSTVYAFFAGQRDNMSIEKFSRIIKAIKEY